MNSPCDKVIRRDITRTYPEHDLFKEQNGLGQESLFNVIKVCSINRCERIEYRSFFRLLLGLFIVRPWSGLLSRYWLFSGSSIDACRLEKNVKTSKWFISFRWIRCRKKKLLLSLFQSCRIIKCDWCTNRICFIWVCVSISLNVSSK